MSGSTSTVPSTALAFIKTLDAANGYALTNFIVFDTTNAGTEWSGSTISLAIDASLEGFDPQRTRLWPTLEAPGEGRLAAWRIRPPGALRVATERRRYDERDLFSAIVLQV